VAVNARESSQAKTEPPTQKRLKDARKRGEVAKSPDVAATVAVIAGIVFLTIGGGALLDRLRAVLDRSAGLDFRTLDSPQALIQWTQQMLLEAVWITVPVVVVLAAVGVLVGFFQVGPVFAAEQIKPQLSRINPIEGFKRLFSMRSVVELLKLTVKTAALFTIIWVTVRSALPELLRSHWLPDSGVLPLTLYLLRTLCWSAIVIFVAIAAFDLWFQNWDFRRRQRMSVEEVRREHKELEGDPHLRGRRRQLHREVGEASMLGNVRRASVVVVNPTHIAVALYYQPGETDLPVVVAKGEGELARAIRRVAEEEGIPVLHNVDLARQLRAEAPIDQYIPEQLIEPVAAVLRWARNLQRP
jgi:type III secretion protein U